MTEEIYQEFLPEAEQNVSQGIETLTDLYKRTIQFEEAQAKMKADQEAQAKIAAQQKAEADRLAKIAAEQEKARKDAEAVKAKAEAEAKAKREAEAAKIAAERKAMEDEKAALQAERDRMAAEAEKVKFADRVRWCESIGAEWYAADWNDAYKINDQIDLGQAMADDIEAARLEALKPDREKLLALVKAIDAIETPEVKSDIAWSICNTTMHKLNMAATELEGMIKSL